MTYRAAPKVAIAGLGMTELGRAAGRTPRELASEAVTRAADDAGVAVSEIDGLLISEGSVVGGVPIDLQQDLGLTDLRLLSQVQGFGASAGGMVSYAAMAIGAGQADVVACVFADTPLRHGTSDFSRPRKRSGFQIFEQASGFIGPTAWYALAARRHMETYGTTSEHLGAIAVSQRAWAVDNPLAQMRDPITLEDHQRSRWIVEPLHLLDCCLVTNGGVAVIVTAGDRARHLRQPPVYLWGWGQGHPGHCMERGSDYGLVTGAAIAGPAAMKMAGISVDDVDLCQIYDCYTYTVLVTIEDYGFCAKGEGGPFAASGVLGRGGRLPTNTGGGQLSSHYMWGMTPLSEAVIQARGQGGDRQVPRRDVILVSGNGAILAHHATLVLSPLPPG